MRARGIVVVLTVLFATVPAEAHLGHVILSAERYLKLDVSGHTARVVVSLTLGPEEGRRVLEGADANGDGEVGETERDAYLATWARGLASELPILVDGERAEVTWGEGYMEPIGRIARVPVTVELVARLELGGGRESVRIEDRMVRREVYDRTDVAFRARDQARLVASIVGEDEPTEPTPDVAYDGAFLRGQPVPLVAIVETPPRALAIPWVAIAAALAALALIGTVIVLVRRRRARA